MWQSLLLFYAIPRKIRYLFRWTIYHMIFDNISSKFHKVRLLIIYCLILLIRSSSVLFAIITIYFKDSISYSIESMNICICHISLNISYPLRDCAHPKIICVFWLGIFYITSQSDELPRQWHIFLCSRFQ